MTAGPFHKSGSPRLYLKSSIILGLRVTRLKEGHWRHGGVVYRDDLVRLVVDVPDLVKNRQWMGKFKSRWKSRLEQLELWVISYRIELE